MIITQIALWMLNPEFTSLRYHWEYVLQILKETDEKLRIKINDKLLFGPNFQTEMKIKSYKINLSLKIEEQIIIFMTLNLIM